MLWSPRAGAALTGSGEQENPLPSKSLPLAAPGASLPSAPPGGWVSPGIAAGDAPSHPSSHQGKGTEGRAAKATP